MKRIFVLLIIILQTTFLISQPKNVVIEKIDTSHFNFKTFAESKTKHDSTDFEKAKTLLHWASTSLDWLSTDYQQRTEKEILARGGGNCFELAKVYIAFIKALHIQYRPIAEINIHSYSESRQATAEQKVKQYGNKMSVFGKRHNDHRWLEVFDSKTKQWIPVDPTTNVIGVDEWMKARAWFNERITIDTGISNDMIVPFAIFVTDSTKSKIIESRSEFYLVQEFDKFYHHQLSTLPSWQKWVTGIKSLQTHSQYAFEGTENLHLYNDEISKLAETYQQLKKEFLLNFHQ